MNSQKKKLLVVFIFVTVVIGGGYLLSTFIGRNSIKKLGYKTQHNPTYIDSMVRAKKKQQQP